MPVTKAHAPYPAAGKPRELWITKLLGNRNGKPLAQRLAAW